MDVRTFFALFLAVVLVSSIASVNAQPRIQTTLILEGVPERAYAGDTITLNGKLIRADTGEGIMKSPILFKIKNEDTSSGRETFVTGLTNDKGRFSIKWIVESKASDTFRVRASYMGSADYSDSQSETYTVEVKRLDLLVQTNKKLYKYGDELIISGSGRPNDVLSVFVTYTSGHAVLGTKITIDETGKFEANLLTWGKSRHTEPFLVYARSTTDLLSSERLMIYLDQHTIEQPKGTETLLTLDPPASNATYNEDLLFTGKLETMTGLPIKDATILIKHKDDAKDRILAKGITSDSGRFFINLKPSQVSPKDILQVYGSFGGGNSFLSSSSETHQITFKPRELTLELHKVQFLPKDMMLVYGTAPARERLNIKLIDPQGHTVVSKSLLVSSEESYEKALMHWTKPSYVLPEGEYVVSAETETEDLPPLTVSKAVTFEKPRPLSQYKITGSVWHEDSDGSRLPLGGAKVTISSSYGEIETYTDASGRYIFGDLNSIVEGAKNIFWLEVELDGKYFRLVDGSTSKIVSKRIGNIRLDGMHSINLEPLVFSGKHEMAAAMIFAMQNEIVKFYADILSLEPKKIEIEIFSGETPKGQYGYEENTSDPKIWISKGMSSPRNPYTWDILAHEYTHYIHDLYGGNIIDHHDRIIDQHRGMNHGGFSNPTTADSMAEGFADFMSAVISQHYKKEQAGKFLKYSLEHNFEVNLAKFLSEELSVAGVFWDIYDDGEGDDDGISLKITDIWKIMSGEYDFPSYHEDSGVNAMKRHVYYLKDLHHILTEGQYSNGLGLEAIEELFNNHAIVNGFTDPARPNRI